jgi:F-type H+-transporting ATPase subunit delta
MTNHRQLAVSHCRSLFLTGCGAPGITAAKMKNTPAANTYARAFLEAADAQQVTDSLMPAVQALAQSLGDEKVAAQLGDPRRGPAARAALVKKISTDLKLSALLRNLLVLLAANKRLGEAGAVMEAIVHLANERKGIIEARVETAVALTDAQVAELKKVLMKKLNAVDVVVSEVDVPGLLGGFRAFAAGRVWDCSLKGRLSELTARFAHAIEK